MVRPPSWVRPRVLGWAAVVLVVGLLGGWALRTVLSPQTDLLDAPGYTLVDAHVAWHHDTAGGNAWELFVDGSNLLDEEARPHTSFLKDLAPLPGRGIAFGVRAFF